MKLPSKELLRAVLDDEGITRLKKANNTMIAYWDIYSAQHSLINICELQHKMKEWAYNNSSYYIESYINSGGSYAVVYKDYSEEPYFNCIADTEFEAVIMASEFILKEIA